MTMVYFQDRGQDSLQEAAFPRTNVLVLKYSDLHKGQPVKRELRLPGGLGWAGRLSWGRPEQGGPGSPRSESATASPSLAGARLQLKQGSSLWLGRRPPSPHTPAPVLSFGGGWCVDGSNEPQLLNLKGQKL